MDKKEFCETNVIHNDIVNKAAGKLLSEEQFTELAEFYKIFSDSTRIKILQALLQSEMCVCDISALLKMQQSAISHQLRLLRQSNMVKNRKVGKVVYYSLKDSHVSEILNMGIAHIDEKNSK